MDKATSSDAAPIAFGRLGDGPSVVVVGGLLCDRALTRPTAEELAKHFTVFNTTVGAAATAVTPHRTRSSARSKTSALSSPRPGG